MYKRLAILVIVGLALAALPMTVAALGLDVEVKGGAGVALGTTDNPDVTGAARLAAGGGVGVDLYLLNAGPANVGVSAGVEYSYLTFHSTWNNFGFPGVVQTADSNYSYLNFPVTLVGRIPLSSMLSIVLRAGGFVGYFLGGSSNLTYNMIIPNSTQTLDSSNTVQWEYGLHFTAGTDIGLGGNLSVSPALQFDMGLTDTSVNGAAPPAGPGSFKDTFWSLTVVVGIKYKAI